MNAALALLDLASVHVEPLLYALILGGAVGLEREASGRPAGLRTHVIVCLCSTMLIVLARQVGSSADAPADGSVVFDPNRMGAGIVTGIGFLGAATVLRSGDVLRGLTTAACIWFVAGVGIVLGNELYGLATVATAVVLVVLTLLNRVARWIEPVVYRRLIVIHKHAQVEEMVRTISALLKEEGCRVLDIASGHDVDADRHELVYYVSLRGGLQSPLVTERVAALADVSSARWKLISNPD